MEMRGLLQREVGDRLEDDDWSTWLSWLGSGSDGGICWLMMAVVGWMFVSYCVRFVRISEQVFGSSNARFHSLRFWDAMVVTLLHCALCLLSVSLSPVYTCNPKDDECPTVLLFGLHRFTLDT
jgi:hypothetical protein